jgi:hypothetical protein
MNSVSANSKRHINTVIYYQLHSASFSNREGSFGLFIKVQSRHSLLSKLNKRSPARAEQLNLF